MSLLLYTLDQAYRLLQNCFKLSFDERQKNISSSIFIFGGSLVMGGDLCYKGCAFESLLHHLLLDERLHIILV